MPADRQSEMIQPSKMPLQRPATTSPCQAGPMRQFETPGMDSASRGGSARMPMPRLSMRQPFFTALFFRHKLPWREKSTRMPTRTLLHTLAHSCTLLHTLAHSCTLLHTLAHSCTLLHTLAHSCTLLHTLVHSCTCLLRPQTDATSIGASQPGLPPLAGLRTGGARQQIGDCSQRPRFARQRTRPLSQR